MCYCFHSFKDLWLIRPPFFRTLSSGFVKRTAKLKAFIISIQIFLPFSEDLFPRILPENLSKNYHFFEVGCKGKNAFLFNQIFLSSSSALPPCLNPLTCRRTDALFKADGKDTTSILTIKVFLQRTFRFWTAVKASVSKRVAKIGAWGLPPNIFGPELFTFP
jgi:hypothetical protein